MDEAAASDGRVGRPGAARTRTSPYLRSHAYLRFKKRNAVR
jgi:hypothetical protein